MNLNPIFLKTYSTLADEKSFTKTAKKLNMTQPGVSQHIKWLEETLDVSLIKRFKKSFELTFEGKKLLKYSQQLFNNHELFLDSLKKDDPHFGKCTFSSPGSFGIKMYSFLLNLNLKYPNLSIHYTYSPNQRIEENILNGEIEMGFMSMKPKSNSVKSLPLTKEKLCLIVPKKYKNKTITDLFSLGFIDHPDGADMANTLLFPNFPKEFKGHEFLKISGANNQISRILEPVSLGLGFTVLPEYACRAFPLQKSLHYFPLNKNISNTIYIVTKRNVDLPGRYRFILDQFKN